MICAVDGRAADRTVNLRRSVSWGALPSIFLMLIFAASLAAAKAIAQRLARCSTHDWIYTYRWVRVCSRCDVVERRSNGVWS